MGKMGKVEKISVSLPKEMVETVNQAVESGDYATASEVVREALRKWESDRAYDRAIKTYGLERLRSLVREGMESGPAPDADEVFAEVKARLEHKWGRGNAGGKAVTSRRKGS